MNRYRALEEGGAMQECETLTFDLCDGVSISEPKMLISSKERSSERASCRFRNFPLRLAGLARPFGPFWELGYLVHTHPFQDNVALRNPRRETLTF